MPAPSQDSEKSSLIPPQLNDGDFDILVCKAGGRFCGLPLVDVVETMRILPCQPVAAAIPCVNGISLVRGQPCPVVDLGRLLGVEETAHRLVLLRIPETQAAQATRRVALAVSSVEGISRISLAQTGQLPPLLSGACGDALAAITTYDAELMMILRTACLLPESSWAALEAS